MASMYPEYGEHWNDQRGGESLATAVWRETWPTPSARDSKGPGTLRDGGPDLPLAVGGQLNPRWVEWLMGYPDGWTDSADSATP